jgi:ribosomal-protein-alanine N-acetyltransferase
VIVGTNLTLRAYAADDDAVRLADIAGSFEVARWMTHLFPHPYTHGDAQAWIAMASQQSPVTGFAIVVDGELAGGIGLQPQSGESGGIAKFGYWLGRAYWGRGLATEAGRLVVDHAFRALGLRRLEARVAAPNGASARVLEKCGFRREGVLREGFVERNGGVHDALLFGLLRSEAAQ